MFADLLNSSYFALFLIVALGFMLGRIKIKGLSLDVSAVIFIALLFGHFGVIIPKELGNFGLVLFIFTIGIQAGPGFFDSFRSKGKTLIIITLLIICSAALTAVGLKYAFDIDTPSVVGLIAGALTSTPGLAVAIDSTHSPLASIAYGIAYPIGVIGVILFVKLLPRIMRIDLDKEARRLEKERRSQFPELTTCLFRVTNPAVFDRSLMQINARAMTGAVISRHKHNEQIAIPTAQTILHEGDYIQAVGSEEALNQLAVLVGQREEGELPLVDMQEIESLLLTKKDMINKQLGDLILMKNFDLISIIAALFAVMAVYNVANGSFHLGFSGQPIAHSQHLWNILGMYVVGFAAVLAGGCPLRQLILAGQGSSDSAVTFLGMLIGAAFAHNFGLVGAAA